MAKVDYSLTSNLVPTIVMMSSSLDKSCSVNALSHMDSSMCTLVLGYWFVLGAWCLVREFEYLRAQDNSLYGRETTLFKEPRISWEFR